MTKKPKTRTITLTGRTPIRIREDQWPVIAEASSDLQNSSGTITVRRHRDGLILVYATSLHKRAPTAIIRAGRLLETLIDHQTIIETIRCVAKDCGLSAGLARACIASLL